jgi:hypothetical protein
MPLMFFAPAMMIIFVVVCLAMIFFMVRSVMGRRSPSRDALDILRERYARGEIQLNEMDCRVNLVAYGGSPGTDKCLHHAASRARSCGAERSIGVPLGMMPVGLSFLIE